MADRGYDVRRNEFGDEFRYKSGSRANSRWTGTRVCLGKREKRTFVGDYADALNQWAEWSHECEREAPQEQPTPVVPAQYRVKEEEVSGKIADETRAEIEELLEAGDMTQSEIADAYGISQTSVSRINQQLLDKTQRDRERQAIREEERQLRADERARGEQTKREPLPDNFRTHGDQTKPQPRRLYAIATEGTSVTLFSDPGIAEKVARMMNSVGNGLVLTVVECDFFDGGEA